MKLIPIKKNSYLFTVIVSVILLLLVTLNRDFAYLNLGYDYVLQSTVTKSFVEGHGFSVPYANPEDIAEIHYKKVGLWPLGYSILHAPILVLTNYDIIFSYRIMSIITNIFLICTLLLILLQLAASHKKWFIPAIMVFWAFSYYPFKYIGVNDKMSIAFFLLSFWLTIKYFKVFDLISKKKAINLLILIGFTSFLPSFFRFAYYPISFVIPFTIIAFKYFKQKKLDFITLLPFAITAFLILTQMFLMNSYFGADAGSIDDVLPEKTKLIYWENLKSYDAIFLNAFVDDENMTKLTDQFLPFEIHKFFAFFISSLLIFIGIIIGLLKVYKTKKFSLNNNYLQFTFIAIFSSLTTVGFLLAISLWYPPFSLEGETFNRTWIWFTRYHALVLVFIQIFIFSFLFHAEIQFKKITKFLFVLVLLVSTAINGFYWLYHEKKFETYKPEGVLHDFVVVKSKLKSYGSTNKTIYLSTKVSTENEFRENDFAGHLLLQIDGVASLKDMSSLKASEDVICIIAVPTNKDHKLYALARSIVNDNQIIDSIYSEGLNKQLFILNLENNN